MSEDGQLTISPLDTMSDAELIRELVAFFGPQRFVEIMGWAFICGLVSEILTEGDPAKLRREMEARNFGTQSSFYRALRDLRRFGEHMEGCQYRPQDHRPTLRIAQRVSLLRAA